MKPKLTYLAVPYTHKNERVMQERFELVTRAAGWLTEKYGWTVFSPITHSHVIHKLCPGVPGDWQTWQKIDYDFMDCSCRFVVLTVPGWSQSIGVTAERAYAEKLNLPIWRMKPDGDGFKTTVVTL